MTLLLLAPPNTRNILPRSLIEIGNFVRHKGFGVAVLPLSSVVDTAILTPEEQQLAIEEALKSYLESPEISVVGISNQFTKDYPQCVEILRICKKLNESVITVIGGAHVTYLDRECAVLPYVDIVVRGEGEWTMLDILQTLKHKQSLSAITGITTVLDGRIVRTPDRQPGDLADLPNVSFDFIGEDIVKESHIYGMLNRGCEYRCKFCFEAKFWKKRRSFPVHRLIAEMEVLSTRYNTKLAAIEDSMLHLGSLQFAQLSGALEKKKLGLKEFGYIQSRVDDVDQKKIDHLKTSGITDIWIGIESGSQTVLKMMNKKTTPEQVLNACNLFRDNGIRANAFWMIGHPGDNVQEQDVSFQFGENLYKDSLLRDSEIALFLPYPGTPYFTEPAKYGIEILDYDYSKWERWCDQPVCQLKDFSKEQIVACYRRWDEMKKKYRVLDVYERQSGQHAR